MKPLTITLFGVPRLERAGEVVDVSRRKVVALMAYLAVTGQPQSRDALAALLWPDYDQSSARANLRRDLSRLKNFVGEEYLKVDRNQAEIVRGPTLELDVATFAEALEQVRRHHPAGRQICDDCASVLASAVALYQDDFMAGFALPDSAAFDDWHFFQSEGLRQQLAEALQRLVDWHVTRAEYERAVVYGRRWVALDPLHEPAQRRLMQLYAWSGQQAAAMRQYQEAVRLLEEELGVAPEEETNVLFETIRSRQLAAPQTKTGPDESSPEGRYELLDLLAVGGHAEVYYGRDRQSGADVVIKRLKPELLVKDRSYLERLIREGAALSRLEHPNIVRMLASFEEEGHHNIVIEYVPGGSLRQLLDREGPLAMDRAVGIALELADALARAHHLNVIHRDLKPDNVLLAADGTPRLTDFGLARLRRDDVRLTRTGAVMGSPAYMSPEALRGEELEPRSDIWSFGVLLYEILAGRKPFEGQQLTPVLVSILQDEAPPITRFRPDVPRSLIDLIQRMLQKEPQRRPLSMRQVAAELEAIAAGKTDYLFATPEPMKPVELEAVQKSHPLQSDDSATVQSRFEPEPSLFVGRQQTLRRLDAVLQAAVAGNAGVAFVTGEAGQGKTSLLKAFVRSSQQQHADLLVAGGNCNAYTGSGDPYLPFREILEMLTGDVEALAAAGDLSADHLQRLQAVAPHTLQALVETGPDLVDTFVPARNLLSRARELHSAANGDASWRAQLQVLAQGRMDQRERGAIQQSDLFEQYARVVQALCRHRPILLFLDDLQWVDRGSASLLLHLGRRLQGHPVMILGAYRPAEVALGQDGARHPLEVTLYELQRVYGQVTLDLSQEEGRPFIDALLDSEPNRLDETFRDTLYQQTGGHPLFTIELLRGMQERGDLIQDSEGRWIAQPELDWHTLPGRVEGAIGERVSRLSPQLRELLEIASVEGEEFTAETVARVLGQDERIVTRQFSGELDRDHLLVRALGIRHAGNVRLSRYRFRHILIQRYLYNSMDAVEKVYQHEAVARALEELYGSESAAIAQQLARHFQLAELPAKAAAYLLEAGDQARRAIALEEAAQYFLEALQEWPSSDQAGQAAILRKIGECQWIMGELQQALATYEECFKLFERTGDLQGAGAVQRAVGRLYWEIGDRERSLNYYHRSLETLEKIPESVELAWTSSSISQMHMLASQYDEAIKWGQRALDLARTLSAEDVMTHALNNVGVAYMETGKLEQGKAMVRESLQRALALGLPHDVCRAYLNLGEVPAGDYEERRVVLQELESYASSIRAPLYAGSAHIELADIEWQLGEWRAAQARRSQIQLWMERAPSIGYLRGMSSVVFGTMHNDLGQFDQALEALEATLPHVRSQNEVQIIGPHLGQVVRALAAQGRDEEAVSILKEMLHAIEQQPYVHRDSTPSLLFACCWLALRQPLTGALAMARQCQELLQKADAYGTKPDAAASLREAQGALHLAQGQTDKAVAQLEQAAQEWRELRLPYHEARALILLARALQQSAGGTAAQAPLERAAALLGTLAAELDGEDRESFLDSPPLQAIAAVHPAALSMLQMVPGAQPHVDEVDVANGTPPEAAQRAAHNLPVQSTPFVGRQTEIVEVQKILSGAAESLERAECRLLTLVGPGGIGKTRLALAAAAGLVNRFEHGVFFVPLAPLSAAEHIISALSESLGLTSQERNEPQQQLLDYLRERELLLVVDNFEHLLEGAELVAEILAQSPRVKIIATSRERLNLSQETLYTVGGLDFPDEPALRGETLEEGALRRYSAVDLLLQRARMVAPGLSLSVDDLQQAVRICHIVQGMPLALVLAAGWLELLTFEEIAAELSESLTVLESTARDVPERQRSVHAAFDYSWKRLPEADRKAFMILCVFRGGFTRQAAQAVAGAGLRTLRTLGNKSFVSTNRRGRFEIHEVLRQLGLEKLERKDAVATARRKHSDYYLEALRDREPDLRGGRQLEALEEIEVELENVRGAWRWALQQQNLVPVAAALESMFLFGYMRSRYTEGIELLQSAREHLPSPESPLWGRVVSRLAFLRAHASPEPALLQETEQALAQARHTGDAKEIAFGLLARGCGTVYIARDTQAAIPLIESALEQYQALEDHFYVVLTKIWLGYCHGNATGLTNFNRYMREALELAQTTDNKVYAANAISNLAAGAFCEGNYLAAERYSREALQVAQDMGLRLAMAHGKVQISLSHLLNGDEETAETLARKGLREAREINYATTISYALSVLSLCASLRGDGEEGDRLAQEALTIPTTIFGRIVAQWAAGVAACGLQDYEAAWQYGQESIRTAHEAGYPGMTTWALPVLAVVLAERQHGERAVALLGLATEHALSPTGWMERCSLLAETRRRLQEQMGTGAYQAAWREGMQWELQDVVHQLLAPEAAPATEHPRRPARALPSPAMPLVGREDEVAALRRLILEGSGHLVTVLGPGGIGKTRLALAAAEALAASFSDGVFFVPLAPLTTAERLAPAIAEQIGFHAYGSGDLGQQLLGYVRERHLLLVLDNFEHLLEGAALVADLLSGAPGLKVLITSRERLNLSSEVVYELHGLDYPAGEPDEPFPAGAADCSAVKLLLGQAKMAVPGYTPSAGALAAAVRIARLVQGMPLALVLAASWFSLLSLEEIADEISANLDFLESTTRDLPPRQQSVRAVFEGSWKLLGGQERSALARLSVFRGSFSREAAQAVAGASARTLLALLHKSWLYRDDEGRLQVHELLRQYAAEKLRENEAEWEETQRRHAHYYAEFLDGQLDLLRGPDQQRAYAAIKADLNNIQVAWRWLLQRRDFEIIASQMLSPLFRCFETRTESYTLLQLLEEAVNALSAIEIDGKEALHATLLTALGAFFRSAIAVRLESYGMVGPAREDVVREAWALAEQVGGLRSGFWDTMLGYIYGRLVDREEGIRHLRQRLPTLQRDTNPWERAFALQTLALLLMQEPAATDQFALDEAKGALTEAIAIFETVDDPRERSLSLRSLGHYFRLQHDFSQAIERWMAAQSQLEAIGEWTIAADINWQIGDAHLQMGEIETALAYFRRMSRAYFNMGHTRAAALVLSKESYEAARYGYLEEARQTREEALAIARKYGDLFAEAWSSWEMGELLRLSGETDAARTWFEQARVLFEKFGDATGSTFYHRGRGDLALAAGKYEEAQREFGESLKHAQATNHKWAMAYALTGIGLAAIESMQLDEARRQLSRGLRYAREKGDGGIMLRALAVAARYFQAVGDADRALELAALVSHHPISWKESRALVAELQALNAPPVERLAEVESSAKELDLAAAVERAIKALAAVDVPATGTNVHNLPLDPIPFVGRDLELSEVQNLLTADQTRLLTLVGPGGIGKTRLALAVAGTVFEAFEAVSYVTLAALGDAEQIASEIGATLGLQMSGADPRQQLLNHLRGRRILLVLDNFEHLLAGATLVRDLLAAAPQVKVLATSRERLNLSGEVVYALQGLDYPRDDIAGSVSSDLAQCSAVKLLLQQAGFAAPRYTAKAEELLAAVRIAQLVQGMPLALILAAGWLEIMSFGEIADEIATNLDFLTSDLRDLPERQQSVRAVFDASWRRLDVDMQRVFRKLAVFRGGFTRPAAQAVAQADAHVLRVLVNKSFVSARRGDRFQVHELLRQFGEEALEEEGEAERTRDDHSHYYLQAVARQTDRLKGPEQLAAVERIEVDFENVRAAWIWAVQREKVDDLDGALEALTMFFSAYRRNPDEFDSLLKLAIDRLVDRSAPDLPGSRLLTALAQSLSYAAKPERHTREDLQRALALAQEHNSELDQALALYGLAHYAMRVQNSLVDALGYYQRSYEQFEAAGETYYAALTLGQVAYCQKALGRLQEAIEGYDEVVRLHRKLGDHINAAVAVAHLAETNLCLGRYDVASRYEREALGEAEAVGRWFPLPAVNARIALQRFLRGEIDAGAQEAEAAYRTALETRAQVTGIGRPYALSVMSLKRSLDGEYEAARALAQQSVEIAANLTVLGQILSQLALSVAFVGLDQKEGAWQAAMRAHRQAKDAGHTGLLTWPLPVLAIVRARQGQQAEATELLALAFSHPSSLSGWLAHWPLIDQLQKDLREKLGEEAYREAWERGRRLDPTTVSD